MLPYSCSLPACRKPVRTGIECTNCKSWLHTSCANLSTKQLREHTQNPTRPWFCNTCLSNPIVRSMVAIIKHYETKLEALQEQLARGPLIAENCTPPAQAAKRMKVYSGSIHQQTNGTELPKHLDQQNLPPADNKTYASVVTGQVEKNTLIDQLQNSKGNKRSKPMAQVATSKESNEVKKGHETLTVICSNLPEPTSNSVAPAEKKNCRYGENYVVERAQQSNLHH